MSLVEMKLPGVFLVGVVLVLAALFEARHIV
jgi:hypothetical protein